MVRRWEEAGGRLDAELEALVMAVADGYPFPTNLDRRPPAPSGMAPESEQEIVLRGLKEAWGVDRVAYSFSWRDSIRPLADITNRLGVYGVPPENIANLVLIHQDITRLRRPDGPDFLIPPPPQSIDREVHCIPTGHLPWALARFGLTKSTYDGVEYRALPDLPGLFMSILGRAPTTASRRNFYLLLTAVYGQWCAKLIPQGRRGLPCVFQCGWTKAGEFHLGAFRGVFAVCG
ncbi:hypothetical protein CNMCM5793_004028 [Aspergillus hiratsukae]|uniref:Uncharacterized protein n=1 Tax=Aspergillus hiratsukae TaxID=1194566 RepID=A0A8H6PEK9_9EURO|nr:hypothetical protein CNMCM5793_004028 [Aspergillus hiratsukae]